MPRDNSILLVVYPEIDRTLRRNLRAQTNQTGEIGDEVEPKAIGSTFNQPS